MHSLLKALITDGWLSCSMIDELVGSRYACYYALMFSCHTLRLLRSGQDESFLCPGEARGQWVPLLSCSTNAYTSIISLAYFALSVQLLSGALHGAAPG